MPKSPQETTGSESAPSAALYLRNDEGVPVDAVPFLVVLAMGFLVSFSFGPMYGMALGWSLELAVVASGVVFVATGAGAYFRLVRQARRELREEVPATQRLRRLFYAALALVVIMLGLALPFL